MQINTNEANTVSNLYIYLDHVGPSNNIRGCWLQIDDARHYKISYKARQIDPLIYLHCIVSGVAKWQ